MKDHLIPPPSSPLPSAPPRRTVLVGALFLALTFAPVPSRADLDVVFVLDTTGSMGGEIAEVQDRVRQLAVSLAESRPGERIRFGIVAFRDRGDDYVTRSQPLMADVATAAAFLDGLVANGGGDGPEAVVAALAAALREMPWDLSEAVDRQIFLIGDAPPHLDYEDDPDPETLLAEARRDRIAIHTIGCRSLPRSGVDFFRAVAYATEGSYQHIGRVRAAQPGALARALDETARAGGPTAERGRPVALTWLLHDDAPSTGILVRRIATEDLGQEPTAGCAFEVRLPSGVGLSGDPEARLSPDGLHMTLELVAGDGGRDVFSSRGCPPLRTPIHVALGGR